MDVIELAKEFGLPVALLLLAVWALGAGKVVPRYVYDAKDRENEEWKRLALAGTRTASEAVKEAQAK